MDIFELITILFVLFILLAWIFYFLSLPYWKRKDFWEKYTWVGYVVMLRKMKNMREPGRILAKISAFFMIGGPILFVLAAIVLRLVGYK
jgi:hypothetical protein